MNEDLEFERFIEKIHKKSGLDLSQYKRKQMERRIRSLMKSNNIDNLEDYFLLLDRSKEHYDKFTDHLTINVSEFFRNIAQWDYLRNTIVPRLVANTDSLKVWSAGCSTGEEPYTLAIMLSETLGATKKFSIHATDLDREVLRKANLGIYNERALANVDNKLIDKYLEKNGTTFVVKDILKKHINFRQHNLLKDSFETNYDLILCRNVVIYFTEETKFELYKRFNTSLKTGGVFFTGNTEQIFRSKEIGFNSIAPFFYEKTL